jgi:hypothetical protein
MNVYTKLAADGTFIVVTESEPFDTFKAAKREELKQAERIGERESDSTPTPVGTCDKCNGSGVPVADYIVNDIVRHICHECLVEAVKHRTRPAGVTLAASEMWDKGVVDYLETR